MKMTDCPKFEKCNAPVCPLHDGHTTHLKGEPVCFYLREYVKQGGKAKLRGVLPGEMVDRLGKVLPEVVARHSDINKQLKQSALTGSKMDALSKPRREAA